MRARLALVTLTLCFRVHVPARLAETRAFPIPPPLEWAGSEALTNHREVRPGQ